MFDDDDDDDSGIGCLFVVFLLVSLHFVLTNDTM